MGKKIAIGLALIGLLALAACAAGGSSSDNQKQGGFYSGVTGGWTQP
jgi:hypothetical protein